MASFFGVVAVCGAGVGVVAVNNISQGKDPFPALLAGGVFTTGTVFISEADEDLAFALAWVFLLSQLLLKSGPVINLLTGLSGAGTGTEPPRGGSATIRKNTGKANI